MSARTKRKLRISIPPKIIGLGLAGAVLLFVIGYFAAVRILFPPLPEPKSGIVVPRLTGLLVPAAEAQLARLGLRVVDVVQIAHPTQPPGVIVAQNPLPGQQLRTAGAVTVAVSSGLPRINVPNVIGFTLERAVAALNAVGLQADQRSEASDQPAGTIIRTEPGPGTEQATPGRILLFISSGPAPVVPDSSAPPKPDSTAVSASKNTT